MKISRLLGIYVELFTRITTQSLVKNHCDEEAALSSIHSLFKTTRGIMKQNGHHCVEFVKIAVLVLNLI